MEYGIKKWRWLLPLELKWKAIPLREKSDGEKPWLFSSLIWEVSGTNCHPTDWEWSALFGKYANMRSLVEVLGQILLHSKFKCITNENKFDLQTKALVCISYLSTGCSILDLLRVLEEPDEKEYQQFYPMSKSLHSFFVSFSFEW